MQVVKCNVCLGDGLVFIYGSSAAVANIDATITNDFDFQQCQLDLVILLSITEMGDMQLDIRREEVIPPDDAVLRSVQVPFVVKSDEVTPEGDRGVLILIYEDIVTANIPPDNYMLTIQQGYAGNNPLGPAPDANGDELNKWEEIPTWIRMYFNPVNSLEGIAAKSHWHPSRELGR